MANLINGQHKYKQLQEAFNIDQNRIKWKILEECEDNELEESENYWINYCNKIDGWTVINKQKKAKRGSKVKDKSKMVQAQTGEGNGHCTKLCVDNVREIKQMLKDKVSKDTIAAKFDISVTHVDSIQKGRRWKSVVI